ncbi:MAG: class I SAM-dependent methyltransferase [Thermoplasmata archaeon]
MKCESCGVTQVANPPGIDELEAAELKYQETKQRDYERHPQWQLEVETIDELALKGGKALDVGCGDGTFLSMLGDHWKKFGVEINPERSGEAKAKGIEVQICNIMEADFPLKFDLITMYEVIEHLYRPADALKKVKTILAQDGLLVISTPDSESAIARLRGPAWWSYHYPPHIFFFGHSWFEKMIKGIGFRILRRRFGVHGSPFRGRKGRKLEALASGSPLVAKNPLGDRMFYYLRKERSPPTQRGH